MFYYTYVIQSSKDSGFYIEYTKDLKLRFKEHCSRQVEFTKDRLPLQIIYYEACLNKKDALHREKYLKALYGKIAIRSRLKFHFNK